MSDMNSDLRIELDGLKYEINIANKRLSDYSNRHFNTERENALLYCLIRATELSDGCILCTNENLLGPLYLLTRGLFESLIWVCWITKSNENAQTFVATAKNELKRIAKKNLLTGHGRVFDKFTNEDKTQELLDSDWAKGIHPRLRIESAAKDVGLDKLYTQMYGFLSLHAHGILLESKDDVQVDMASILAIANVFMECINLVLNNWIVRREQTPAKDLYSILQ